MKKRQALSPRQLLFAIFALLVFAALTILLFTYKRDEKRFQHLSHEIFVEELQGNTLNMHYSIAYPEHYGIYQYTPVLPCYSAQGRIASQALTENTLVALRDIDPARLSEADQHAYQLLLRSLELSALQGDFPYYAEPLSPHSGMQSQLPILLAEYTFRRKRDVQDYLKLLDQTDDYFASLLLYEQEKAEAGLLMASRSLEQVVEQCDTIVTEVQLVENTHFLQTTFAERIQELVEAGELTQENALDYLTQNDRLLKEVLLPAYEALADGLFLLIDQGGAVEGLAAHPDGASYYETLLISETGSYRPVSQIKKMLTKQFDLEYQTIHDTLLTSPQLQNWYQEDVELSFPLTDPVSMLADLQTRMEGDFPSLSDTSVNSISDSPHPTEAPDEAASTIEIQSLLPQVTVKSVSPSLEDYCAPAFYLTTPMDDTDNNVIYINQKDSPTGLELYTTLAHEGYPGHLYQNVYCHRSFAGQEENKVRELLWYGGYLEGWAIYTEFYAFDYAADLMEEQGEPTASQTITLEKHNRSLQLCLYSLLDIMIHYENASCQQVAQVLENVGVRDAAAVERVYAYIAEEPCNYLKYYLGYLEILSLKELAQNTWGNAYSDYAFHAFLLDCGPSDFQTLEERLLEEAPAFISSSAHRKIESGSATLSPALPAPRGLDSQWPLLSSADENPGAAQRLFSLFP